MYERMCLSCQSCCLAVTLSGALSLPAVLIGSLKGKTMGGHAKSSVEQQRGQAEKSGLKLQRRNRVLAHFLRKADFAPREWAAGSFGRWGAALPTLLPFYFMLSQNYDFLILGGIIPVNKRYASIVALWESTTLALWRVSWYVCSSSQDIQKQHK